MQLMRIVKIADCAEFTAGDQTLLREVLSPAANEVELRYSLAHARLPPGKTSTPHRLRNSELYVFLAGDGTMWVAGDEQRVSAGHVVYVPPGAVQHVRNDGSGDLVFLCIVDPAWRPEDEEILGGEERAATSPDERGD
jgi:mannose-6-phosphate isomerase-like protein (cupin superfamily)